MTYLYKSTTGSAVNAGSYVVTVTGTSYDEKIPELDDLVGSSLLVETDVVVKAATKEPVVPKEPTKAI